MYSMNRSTTPVPLKSFTNGRIWSSFTPRSMTALTFTGSKPASRARKMPSRTRVTDTSVSQSLRNTASSRASKLTVTRVSPASRSDCALDAKSVPLVVSATSIGCPVVVLMAARRSTRDSMSRRSRGSPPVSRILFTPTEANALASCVIWSKVSRSDGGRNE